MTASYNKEKVTDRKQQRKEQELKGHKQVVSSWSLLCHIRSAALCIYGYITFENNLHWPTFDFTNT